MSKNWQEQSTMEDIYSDFKGFLKAGDTVNAKASIDIMAEHSKSNAVEMMKEMLGITSDVRFVPYTHSTPPLLEDCWKEDVPAQTETSQEALAYEANFIRDAEGR